MRRFDWRKFCDKHHIPYVNSGPNVARNHLGIKCPWCADDPSEHLGLNLDVWNPVWGCLRNAAHRGRDPRRLVQRLLGCSYTQSLKLVQGEQAVVGDLDAELQRIRLEYSPAASSPGAGVYVGHPHTRQSPTEAINRPVLRVAAGIRPLLFNNGHYAPLFIEYLVGRGFGLDVAEVVKTYDLHYSITGEFPWRLLFPIKDMEGNLRGWTGRDIRNNPTLRYKTTGQLARELLFNEHQVWQRLEAGESLRRLYIVEGPVDALKMDYYGRADGCAALGVMGTGVAAEQMARLPTFIKHRGVTETVFLFDNPAARMLAFPLSRSLAEITGKVVVALNIPYEGKDPGKLTAGEVVAICRS